MNQELPADLFTSCLTTPIKIALRWYVLQKNISRLNPDIDQEMIEKIPGTVTDRKSMLGELNWIFTAVTDTIAWNSLPKDIFQRLFRQDLLVASLFRNFLLAERIMRSYGCHVCSRPALPPMFEHRLWWVICLSPACSLLGGDGENNRDRFLLGMPGIWRLIFVWNSYRSSWSKRKVVSESRSMNQVHSLLINWQHFLCGSMRILCWQLHSKEKTWSNQSNYPLSYKWVFNFDRSAKDNSMAFRYYWVNLIVNERWIYWLVFLIWAFGLFIWPSQSVFSPMFFVYYKPPVMISGLISFLSGRKS